MLIAWMVRGLSNAWNVSKNPKIMSDFSNFSEEIQRYRLLFDTMREGAFFQLADGSLSTINDAALEIFGLSREELLSWNSYSDGWEVIDINHESLPPDQHPSMLALASGQHVRDRIVAVRNRRTKEFVWVIVNAIPQFRNEEHNPYCVIVTMHNVTRLIREDEIRDARMRILEYTPAHNYEELLKFTLDQLELLTGSSIGFFHFLEPDQKTLVLQTWSTATEERFCNAEGKGSHYDVAQAGVWADCVRSRSPIIHNDYASLPAKRGMPPGHAAVTREIVVPVFRGDNIVAVLGVGNKPEDYTNEDVRVVHLFADLAWDIAEIKRTETALRESELKFRTLFEELNDGVTLTYQGVIVDANHRMVTLLGLKDRSQLIGRNLLEFMTPDSGRRAAEKIRKIREGLLNEIVEEYNYLRSDGTEISVHVRGSGIEFGGKLYGLSLQQDVTERKKTEAELRSKMEELEKFNNLTVNREIFMIELKKEINGLLKRIGEPEKYRIVE